MRAGAERPRALRRFSAAERYGVSLSTVDRTVRAGKIRTRKVGKATLLNADDCEREFGWPDVEPSAEALAEMAELIS